MTVTTDRYINLFTDFAFKKLFGEEPNKDLLIAFLNELLRDEEQISDLNYLKNERLGKHEGERKAVFDLYCTNERGEKIIVEVQRVKQEYFKDRSVYYSSFAIQEQAAKGKDWKYQLKAVYTIAIMDFEFDSANQEKLEHRIKLMDTETKQVFYHKLTFIYLEIPKFTKQLSELTSNYEKWLFAFKNLHRLRERPKELEEGVFKRLFEVAEIASMNERERSVYEDSLKDYWDLKSAIETYFADGRAEGRAQGKAEGRAEGRAEGKMEEKIGTAKKALERGLEVSLVQELTGLPLATIQQLAEDTQ
ncbi:MAG: Rpn family recombination-promoting nuclease/putative transposase [Tunicatimonas sp.]